jgi:hypothetical protein
MCCDTLFCAGQFMLFIESFKARNQIAFSAENKLCEAGYITRRRRQQ